ncbi:MAG: EAL domain-containing protein [Nitrospirae bacterium]|nr:MAG: EAL domain-containing protein [Nitrospirota bacterium]
MHQGAQDYLIRHQLNSHALARAVRYSLERHRAQAQVVYQAQYDQLTGLANRSVFFDRLNFALARCNRTQTAIALLFLDLDHFKKINDTCGHEHGDMMLKTIGHRLRQSIREIDTGARMGGDEFAILLEHIASVDDVKTVAQRILEHIARPIAVNGRQLAVTGSLGITIYPWDCANAQELLKHSDSAMYRAKAQGGNRYQFYIAGLQTGSIDVELQRALANDELCLYYQPQLDLQTNTIIGMEALLRWQHPLQGLVGPMHFIPRAEENGLIIPIGERVLAMAARQAKLWRQTDGTVPPVAVNLSVHQIQEPSFPATLKRVLEAVNLPAQALQLELTERHLFQETNAVLDTLRTVKAMGCSLYIDDFGTGYSSLRYLRAFPIDGIKLDQSLLHRVPDHVNDATMLRAVIALGKTLGLHVIAEGVARQDQVDFLHEHGCDAIQGFWLSSPVPAGETPRWFSGDRDCALCG